MTLYPDSAYPVSADLAAAHASQLDQLGLAGTWGTGAQRLAIAAAARRAGYDAGILEEPADDDSAADLALPQFIRRIVERLAVSPKDVDQAFYDQALEDGLSDAEYVEIVGIVSRITDIDVFARGIGVALRPLPSARPGEPSRGRPTEAVLELAWAPTIPNGPDGGELGAALYGGKPKPYILRALSLVPDELRAHIELEGLQYTQLDRIFEFDFQYHEGLTRPQVEVVAGRISALNECFF